MRSRLEVDLFTRRCFAGQLAAAGCALGSSCKRGETTLRFSGIPDGDKRDLKVRYAAVAGYLSRILRKGVEYVHVPDYTAAVTSLLTRKVDFAWLGGVTTVQAEQRSQGSVHFVAARESDLHFRSYLVANRDVAENLGLRALEPRTPQTTEELARLAPVLRRRKFSFGAKNSTSGHIMPRAFLTGADVGLRPETDFDGGPVYQLKGGHAATLRAVASGAVDFGVLNFAVWEAASEELKQGAPVVYVTPEYVDYCLVAHDRMDDADVARLRGALVSLDSAVEEHRQVLAAFSAERFVEVDPADWDGVRAVLQRLESTGALR